MDCFTHGLLGAVTAQLGFRQRFGREATFLAAGAAMSPDIDLVLPGVLQWLGCPGDVAAQFTHRGLTHSLLMVPPAAIVTSLAWWIVRRFKARQRPAFLTEVLPPLQPSDSTTHPEVVAAETRAARGAAVDALSKPPSFGLMLLAMLLAFASHPLLDACTTYGTELLAPITRHSFAWDCVPIVDLLFTSILAITLAMCAVLRKGPGTRTFPRGTAFIGLLGLLAAVSYLGMGRSLHDQALQQACALAGKQRIVACGAFPAPGSIFLWRAVVQTPQQWIVARVRPLNGKEAITKWFSLPRQTDNPWVQRALALPRLESDYVAGLGMARETCQSENGQHVVEFHDMRYAPTPQSIETLWSLRIVFDDDGNVVQRDRVRNPLLGRTNWGIARQGWSDLWKD